jgi:excisionase family DNA binding protein
MPIDFPTELPEGSIGMEPHYTVAEVAALLHVSRNAVYRKLLDGEWPYTQVVRTVYVSQTQLRAILALSRHEPDDEPEPPVSGQVDDKPAGPPPDAEQAADQVAEQGSPNRLRGAS